MHDREVATPRAAETHVAPCDDGTAYREPVSDDGGPECGNRPTALVPMQRRDGTPFLLRVGREYLERVLNLLRT